MMQVRYLERKLSATKLSPQPADSSLQQFNGETDTPHLELEVHSPATQTEQREMVDMISPPSTTSTPSKPSTIS